MNFQEKVKEFQLASGQPVSDERRELTKEEFEFRDNLLREEIRELKDAVVDNNRVEILDALCDIVYVALGTCNTYGIKHSIFNNDYDYYDSDNDTIEIGLKDLELYAFDDYCISSVVTITFGLSRLFGFSLENFEIALDRVHASNMSKFCYDIKTAERTQEFYKKQGINTYVEPRQKKFVVYREGDGKVLKSVEYYPVILNDLV